MQKKFDLIGIQILLAFLIIAATGNMEFLPVLNKETQTVSDVQSQSISEASQIAQAGEQPVREYTLIIEQTDIQVSDSAVWHAWTYNGTVPAPTLMVNQGEIFRVKVINNHNLTHIFHAHMSDYDP